VSDRGWWATKVRQSRAHVRATVSPAERGELYGWLTAGQLDLFESMAIADQRHGLDVVATLRSNGAMDPELLLAGLLHDAGKGRKVGLGPRIAWSLGERYGSWVWRLARIWPGFGPAMDRLRDHAEASAQLAAAAGCSTRTVDLIRNQAQPLDADAGARLRLADEAN
jgi:hypothetical protein